MVQIYLNDSKVLQHQGETQATYEGWSDYSPTTHTIIDLSQNFPPNWSESAWFLIPSQNRFVTRVRSDEHPILSAARLFFGENRWQEIRDALDEQGDVSKYLDMLNKSKIKRKVARALQLSLITAQEVQDLNDLVNGP